MRTTPKLSDYFGQLDATCRTLGFETNVPLFLMDFPITEEPKQDDRPSNSVLRQLPLSFPTVKLLVKNAAYDNLSLAFWFQDIRNEDGVMNKLNCVVSALFNTNDVKKMGHSTQSFVIDMEESRETEKLSCQYIVHAYNHGRRIQNITTAQSDAVLSCLLSHYANFKYVVSAPKHHLAKVRPVNYGVTKWLEGSPHFIVVSGKSKLNTKDAPTTGVSMKENTSRIAHTRRAHTRMLRSERYINKRGQTISVRSTWVGPEEWVDEAKSVYRIVR